MLHHVLTVTGLRRGVRRRISFLESIFRHRVADLLFMLSPDGHCVRLVAGPEVGIPLLRQHDALASRLYRRYVALSLVLVVDSLNSFRSFHSFCSFRSFRSFRPPARSLAAHWRSLLTGVRSLVSHRFVGQVSTMAYSTCTPWSYRFSATRSRLTNACTRRL
jgi:hypothetical protein